MTGFLGEKMNKIRRSMEDAAAYTKSKERTTPLLVTVSPPKSHAATWA